MNNKKDARTLSAMLHLSSMIECDTIRTKLQNQIHKQLKLARMLESNQ